MKFKFGFQMIACFLFVVLGVFPLAAQTEGGEEGGADTTEADTKEAKAEPETTSSKPAEVGHKHSGPFPMDVSVYGMFSIPAGYDFGVGAGAQFAYPLFPEGFIKNPKYPDAFFIEGGLDFNWYRWSYGYLTNDWSINVLSFRPIVGVRYQVYFSEEWAVTGAAKAGVAFSRLSWDEDIPGTHDDLDVDFVFGVAPGLLWDISEEFCLRGELNFGAYEYFGIRIGLLIKL